MFTMRITYFMFICILFSLHVGYADGQTTPPNSTDIVQTTATNITDDDDYAMTPCVTRIMMASMGGGEPSCEAVEGYVICAVRVLNLTGSIYGLDDYIQLEINKAMAYFGHPNKCNFDVIQLIQSVHDGSAPPPPVSTPEVREKEDAYNQCMSTYISEVQRLYLTGDFTTGMCGPMKVNMKCIWRVFELDPRKMTEEQKTLVQRMTNDNLAKMNILCGFNVDVLLAELAAEDGAGGVACVQASFRYLLVTLCLAVFFGRRD